MRTTGDIVADVAAADHREASRSTASSTRCARGHQAAAPDGATLPTIAHEGSCLAPTTYVPARDADRDLTRNSYYAATAPRAQRFPPLQGDACECDVAIVGGGLAGLSAAIELAERGFSVVLLEAREVGSGASGRNGGQAIHGLACDQDEIETNSAWTTHAASGT